MADRWLVTYDAENQEDYYNERPSEFILRQIQRACPDEDVVVYRLKDGWVPVEIERRPAYGADGG